MSDVRLQDRRNTIALVVGRKGSGKSHLIAKRLGPSFPRRITVDWTGEARETYPNAIEVFGLADLLDAMEQATTDGEEVSRWHFITVMDVSEVGKLLTLLAPRYDGGRTPSLSAAVGGCVVECSEVDVIAPNSGGAASVAVSDAIARGRHAQLSFLLATQRPAQCLRILSSQSDLIFSFRMHEPRDIRWLSDAAGSVYADAVQNDLQRYQYARFISESGAISLHDKDGRVIGRRDVSAGTEPGERPADDD
jgi:hypothetical protein